MPHVVARINEQYGQSLELTRALAGGETRSAAEGLLAARTMAQAGRAPGAGRCGAAPGCSCRVGGPAGRQV